MAKRFVLLDKSDGHRVPSVSLDQLFIIALSISAGKVKNWFVREEESTEWSPLKSFLDSHSRASVSTQVSGLNMDALTPTTPTQVEPEFQAPPLAAPLIHDSANGERTATLQMEEESARDRRGQGRFSQPIEVLIQTEKINFKTRTESISIGDIRLKEALPDGLPKVLVLQLKFRGETLKLQVQSIDGPPAKALKILKNSSEILYRTWMLS